MPMSSEETRERHEEYERTLARLLKDPRHSKPIKEVISNGMPVMVSICGVETPGTLVRTLMYSLWPALLTIEVGTGRSRTMWTLEIRT